MTEEQLNEIKASLEVVVKKTVNGKIDSLTITLNNHIKADDIWKKEAQPIIDAGKNLSGWGKVTAAMVAIIAAVVGIITGVMRILK